ncbi:MAG TPA: 16S rRNA (cytosine(967)-C(5))-methyltransferase RsmB [Pyrinomonadaceae bacterium]|nr:16S rRNA (cytosine(967)-C(5))-methyltransferase RsmB [Pyrinomonadaceae bacterium]
MASNKVSAARWSAFEILRRVEDGAFSSVLLATEEAKLQASDRALCHELVLGVLRWQLKLDRIIEHYANRKITSLDRSVLIALRIGLYQLRFLTRVPASAAVDESVKLVQAARLSSARAFVNAVLRRATREPEYEPTANISDSLERLTVESSHPRWLIERWIDSFGIEETKAFVRSNNQTPPATFRVVQTRANENEVINRLEAAGIKLQASELVSSAWRASNVNPVLRALADKGEIYFQDEASQLVAESVGAQDGDYILDLCAAPGGKTSLIADRVPNVRLVASDLSERRLAIVSKTIAVQDLKQVSLTVVDASQPLPFRAESFDRILVDAPCSGTGTLARNPEIRWRIAPEDIHRLATQQLEILSNASKVVKQGGRLIYSTCSVEREENEDVVAKFLRGNNHFRQVPLKSRSGLMTEGGALRTWPQHQRTDGFFVTALLKC